MRFAVVLGTMAMLGGCVVVPTRAVVPRPPAPPVALARLAYTVGDFSFALGGADPKTNTLAGSILNDEIVAAWERRGFVHAPVAVDAGDAVEGADFVLTLSGSQHNETSFWAQLLNALTLTLVPYSVTQRYDLHYELSEAASGRRWTAQVRDLDRTYVGIFMLAALPVAGRGHAETVQRMGDTLYGAFRVQGAFAAAAPSPEPRAAPERRPPARISSSVAGLLRSPSSWLAEP